jgi:hypothetical protein
MRLTTMKFGGSSDLIKAVTRMGSLSIVQYTTAPTYRSQMGVQLKKSSMTTTKGGPTMSRDEIPMSHTLQTNGWEVLDSMWGINMPPRYICVQDSGFRLRKKTAFFGGSGSGTPGCVQYGGWGALAVQTIEVKGNRGQTVHFVQGSGDVEVPEHSIP